MTIAVVTRDRIVSDSRLSYDATNYDVGKIFRMKSGGLLVTAGDGKLTYPFERAMLTTGQEPAAIEHDEEDEFEGVILKPDSTIVLYDSDYAPNVIGNPYVVIGSSQATGAALSWLKHDASPEEAVARAIEVDTYCGGKVVTVMLHEKSRAAPPRRTSKRSPVV